MQNVFIITQIVISLLLMLLILAQNKDGGLSAAMGGGQSFRTVKRGAEKVIHRATILLATLFLINGAFMMFA